MKIRLDEAFDAGAWPGPAGPSGASAGESWVGPLGFLGMLETSLGRSGPGIPGSAREAALIPLLRDRAGFWSASAQVDPLQTARRLLGWRDLLCLHGWKGEPVSPRLGALAELTREVLPGLPDRLQAVLEALGSRSAEVASVELLGPRASLPKLWREVLTALEGHGTAVIEVPLVDAPAQGDLQAARGAGFAPTGDGSIQLLRARAPIEAADEVGAFLAALPDLDGVVVIGADTLLDAALRRHGVPTLGAQALPGDNALLQILPLVLSLGWEPADPQRALELLTLPISPVPPALARRLAEALHQTPAVGSEAWNQVLQDGLEAVEDPDRRERLRTRLAGIFEATLPIGGAYPVDALRARTRLLQQWIQGRASMDPDRAELYQGAIRQCLALEELVTRARMEALPEPLIRRYVEEATAHASAPALHPAQAGVGSVQDPGALGGPARVTVWWNFTRDAAPKPVPSGLRAAELRALAALGVELPDPGALRAARARREARALGQTTGTLLLVSPSLGVDGEPSHPHPLWDELRARMDPAATLSPIEVSRPVQTLGLRTGRALRPGIEPAREWTLPAGAIARREWESPSSAETLLGCSLKWVLHYVGGLTTGAGGELPLANETRVLGTVAHAVLEHVFADGVPEPEVAESVARERFDAEAPRMAASLFQRGAAPERARARSITAQAARELSRLLREGGWEVEAVEQALEGEALAGGFRGTPDLVVKQGRRRAVIDFKWAGAAHRRDLLEAGGALQLSAYAHLLQRGTAPDAGYFILSSQRMLSTSESLAGGQAALQGPALSETWTATGTQWAGRWAEVTGGRLVASAIAGDDEDEDEAAPPAKTGLNNGTLEVAAPCRFCDYGLVCGLSAGR